jgi:carbon-monoxide dehydrogenase medium subunit
VIPASFDYQRAESADAAVALLTEHGDDAKLLAGGHSLLPLMKLRLATPSMLIDVGRLRDLSYINDGGDHIAIGALTRHRDIETSDVLQKEVPLLARAASFVGDPQVRHRGTIGGSLAHGDPASDQLAVLLAAEGAVTVQGPAGERTIAAADLFEDYLTTSIAEGEILTAVHLPAMDGYGFGYEKFNRRAEDWAMVAVAAWIKVEGGTVSDVRIGLTNMGSTPLRATAVEEALRGQSLSADSIAKASEQAADGTEPPGDLNATPDYKRHLSRVLTRRALTTAAGL